MIPRRIHSTLTKGVFLYTIFSSYTAVARQIGDACMQVKALGKKSMYWPIDRFFRGTTPKDVLAQLLDGRCAILRETFVEQRPKHEGGARYFYGDYVSNSGDESLLVPSMAAVVVEITALQVGEAGVTFTAKRVRGDANVAALLTEEWTTWIDHLVAKASQVEEAVAA